MVCARGDRRWGLFRGAFFRLFFLRYHSRDVRAQCTATVLQISFKKVGQEIGSSLVAVKRAVAGYVVGEKTHGVAR